MVVSRSGSPYLGGSSRRVSAVKGVEKSMRLDKFLCKKFDISFGVAQKIIREKKVKVNGARVDAAYKTLEEDEVEIFADLKTRFESKKTKPKITDEKMKKFLSWIIFEDENLIAINKPSGLATQGGSGIEISVDDYIKTYSKSLLQWSSESDFLRSSLTVCSNTPRFGTQKSVTYDPLQRDLKKVLGQSYQLVHRLDKDTSGILLIAKNSKAAEFLTDAFKNKTIKKTYLALVRGIPTKSEGVINIPLRKKLLGKNEKVSPDFEEGKEAITEFKILKKFSDYSLLELRPLTGRTHQLRVHCKELGHAIVNDMKYGGKDAMRKDLCKRLCLHAYKIEMPNYFGKKLEIKTELPEFIKYAGMTFKNLS